MRKIAILIWLLTSHAPAWPSTCEAGLVNSQQSVVLKQIAQLNPKLNEPNRTENWADLYVALKKEEQIYAAGGLLNSALKSIILANQSKRYEVQNLNPNELRQFYINALRSLYVRVAAFWTHDELLRINGQPLHQDIERVAGRILESTSSPWSLKDRELSAEAAADFFKNQPWQQLPWRQLLNFIEAWKKHSPYEFSYSEFSNFWDLNAEKFGLDISIFSRLQSALSGHESSLFCCLSEPGCTNCPHNRRWLK
jgi:hypothetical protein